MGTRSSGTAVIQFGLVTVGVKLYVTASSKAFSFNMINPETRNRVSQVLIDSDPEKQHDKDGKLKLVERGSTLSGFQVEEGNYVIFKDEELDALDATQKNVIDISEFTTKSVFNPLAVEKSYFLSPSEGAEKPYRLLARAMRDENSVAVGKWYARGRDHLVIVAPNDTSDALTVYQMYYANELRNHEYTFSKATEPDEKLLKMAKSMIKKLFTKEFDATAYVDEYAERIRAAIDTKKSGGEIATPVLSGGGKAMDLEALLAASMNDSVPEQTTKVRAKKSAADKKPAAAAPADKKATAKK